MPAFFIHPCNTASAMQELAQGMPIALEKYIQVWLGITGSSVGLSSPISGGMEESWPRQKIKALPTEHAEKGTRPSL